MLRRLSVLVVLAAFAATAAPALGAPSPTAQEHAVAALQHVKDLRHGVGVQTGRELTPALHDLAISRKNLPTSAERTEAAGLLARPTDSTDPDYYGSAYIGSVQSYCPSGSIYCFHWVGDPASPDAPDLTDADSNGVPDYIDNMAAAFDEVHACENGSAVGACGQGLSDGKSWPAPVGDGSAGGGGTDKFDVYVKDLYPQGFYGYASTEQCFSNPNRCDAYMVMDKDFSRFATATETGTDAMKVTAAHEYNHVLQYAIDPYEDTWMFESTATYFEDIVYPSINDYVNYMDSWVTLTGQPLTAYPVDNKGTPTSNSIKVYGDAVWNHFIRARHGESTILDAWEAKVQENGGSFAPSSYSAAIATNGGTSFADEFDDFSAAVAEWRVPGSGFPDVYPDIPGSARPGITVGGAAQSATLDHTTFKYFNVPVPSTPGTTLTFTATLPSGLKGAVAIVGRTGTSTTGGTVTKQIARLSSGGVGTVSLANADTYGRVTAVLVNSDTTHTTFNSSKSVDDWNWSKDGQVFTGIRVTSGTPPVVSTDPATLVSQTGATLNGHVNPEGGQNASYYFEYGPTTAYGSQTAPASPGSGTSSLAFSSAISGLTRGTTYHYRIVAQSDGGTTQGNDQTFTTLDPPVASTSAATAVTASGATLNAAVDPRGRATTYFFQYGPTTSYGSQLPATPAAAGSGTGSVSVAQSLSGLSQGTTTHYRVVAQSADGTSIGGDQSFRTLDPPFVTTGTAGTVTTDSATLTGTVDPQGKPTTYTFEYGTTTAYGSSVGGSAGTSSSAVSVANSAAGLAPGTLYHFRLVATNADGTTAGSDATFRTASPATSAPSDTGGGGTTGGSTDGTSTSPPPSATLTPSLTVSLAVVKAKLAAVLKKGLVARPSCSSTCTVTLKLVLPAKLARKLRLKTTIATARGAGGTQLRLRVSKKTAHALARLRKLAVKVVASAVAPDGRKAALTKSITLKR